MRYSAVASVLLWFVSTAAVAKDCTIGKPCGDTCIELSDTCHIERSVVQSYYGTTRDPGPDALSSTLRSFEEERSTSQASASPAEPRANYLLDNPNTYDAPVRRPPADEDAQRRHLFAAYRGAGRTAYESDNYAAAVVNFRLAAAVPLPESATVEDKLLREDNFYNLGVALEADGQPVGAAQAYSASAVLADLVAAESGPGTDTGFRATMVRRSAIEALKDSTAVETLDVLPACGVFTDMDPRSEAGTFDGSRFRPSLVVGDWVWGLRVSEGSVASPAWASRRCVEIDPSSAR